MTSKDYLDWIEKHPGILPDEAKVERTLRKEQVDEAKVTIEQDLCEKRIIITKLVEAYKEEIQTILSTKQHHSKKTASIDTILEEKVIPTLNDQGIFDSLCSHPYEHVFFKPGHILTHCPGDVARAALVKFFIQKIKATWQIPKGKSILTVCIEHSDGQCAYHTAQMEKDFT